MSVTLDAVGIELKETFGPAAGTSVTLSPSEVLMVLRGVDRFDWHMSRFVLATMRHPTASAIAKTDRLLTLVARAGKHAERCAWWVQNGGDMAFSKAMGKKPTGPGSSQRVRLARPRC